MLQHSHCIVVHVEIYVHKEWREFSRGDNGEHAVCLYRMRFQSTSVAILLPLAQAHRDLRAKTSQNLHAIMLHHPRDDDTFRETLDPEQIPRSCSTLLC